MTSIFINEFHYDNIGADNAEIEFVPNIDENMTDIFLNGEIIAILEKTQIIDTTDLDFIEYQSIQEI